MLDTPNSQTENGLFLTTLQNVFPVLTPVSRTVCSACQPPWRTVKGQAPRKTAEPNCPACCSDLFVGPKRPKRPLSSGYNLPISIIIRPNELQLKRRPESALLSAHPHIFACFLLSMGKLSSRASAAPTRANCQKVDTRAYARAVKCLCGA